MSKIGIIGGSALYSLEGLDVTNRKRISTPFGDPSDEFIIGRMAGKECIFLPRHGHSHNFLPTEINYRANIYAFKVLGVERIISVAAVGSLKKNIRPMDVVIVDQFIDRTNQARPMTFFGDGIVAHIPFADPVCSELCGVIYKSNEGIDSNIHKTGTYLNMEGPAFSTKAESFLYRSWGVDIVGMTNMAEARLAREAGICYSTMAMVTDYDCWYQESGVNSVSVDMIMENVHRNIETAKLILKNTIINIPEKKECDCSYSLTHAIVTPKDAIPKETLEKLRPILNGVI